MRINKKSARLLLVTMLIALVGAATYAFTASNTVGDSSAGSGTGDVSGYAVSNLSYTINPLDATTLSSVAFDLAPLSGSSSANAAKVKLGATTYDCVVAVGGGSATCDVTGAAILPLANIDVTAVS